MQITTITYERLKSGPGFNNERVGISVILSETDDPDEAFRKAKAFVDSKLNNGQTRLDFTSRAMLRIDSPDDDIAESEPF